MQRLFVAAAATRLGYNVLVLDTDVHLAVAPRRLLYSPRLRAFDLLVGADKGFLDLDHARADADFATVHCPRARPTARTPVAAHV